MFVRLSKVFRKSQPKKGPCYTQAAENCNPVKNVDPLQLNYLENELCVLVDERDNVIGTASKKDCHKVSADGTLLLHRAFSLFLFNGRGDIYIQRRSEKKIHYQGYYSNTICSHPLFINGKVEDYKTAVKRKLHHELNVPLDQVDPKKMHLMTRVHYNDPLRDPKREWGEHEMDYIVVMQADLDLTPNEDEIAELHCVPREQLDEFMSSLKGPVTPWFTMVRRNYLQLWWDNLHRLKEVATPHRIEKLDINKYNV